MTPADLSTLFEAASTADYPEILALNDGAVPAVNRIDTPVLTDLHQQSLALIVARRAGRVAGFLLALGESADYASVNFQYFKHRYAEFAYIDRIVVGIPYRRAGVGVGLYRALAEVDRETLTCEVNLIPPNPNSLAFHRDLGFTVVDEQDTEGGAKRVALMVKN